MSRPSGLSRTPVRTSSPVQEAQKSSVSRPGAAASGQFAFAKTRTSQAQGGALTPKSMCRVGSPAMSIAATPSTSPRVSLRRPVATPASAGCGASRPTPSTSSSSIPGGRRGVVGSIGSLASGPAPSIPPSRAAEDRRRPTSYARPTALGVSCDADRTFSATVLPSRQTQASPPSWTKPGQASPSTSSTAQAARPTSHCATTPVRSSNRPAVAPRRDAEAVQKHDAATAAAARAIDSATGSKGAALASAGAPGLVLTPKLTLRLMADLVEALSGSSCIEAARLSVGRRWGFDCVADMLRCIEAQANASYQK
eukprot:TRINITY_DN29027_c0_g1_i1.p1 TRINITY_DN29027_c0_g1~~TRINITY_DN29027_c0_g1_i1.p1  ORF type:complete len:311 (-),score=31.78 TRINITY_DN29027_c0_g1_i1:109-1041(-)